MAQREECVAGSEEVELSIRQILAKIERFTEMVSVSVSSGGSVIFDSLSFV